MQTPAPLTERFTSPSFKSSFANALPGYLPTQRWFTSKGKKIDECHVERVLRVTDAAALLVVRVDFADGSTEMYQMPVAQLTTTHDQMQYTKAHPGLVMLQVPGGPFLVDAVPTAAFRAAIYEMIRSEAVTNQGLRCDAGKLLRTAPATAPSVVPAIDTSNTAIVYNDQFFFKLFRKLDKGLNPDLELVRYLSERADFQHCPPYGGSIGIGQMHDADYLNLGMMSGKVDNDGDAWEYFQGLTERYYTHGGTVDRETLDRAELLGKRTAEMHLKLARGADAGAMLTPEAMSPDYRTEITAAARKLLNRQMGELADKLPGLTPEQRSLAKKVLGLKDQLDDKLQRLATKPMDLDLIRIHGDYHLGQVLVTAHDFYIIDFEGEPLLSIPERRRKRPALKDVAGMVRSFHYAARGQLLLNPKYSDDQKAAHAARGERWFKEVSEAYLAAYFAECGLASFLPKNEEDRSLLLDLFILEKAIYEVAYELNSRPEWLSIPLSGVLGVAE
ncbi:maltokinase N-terminal cap-like domain-containing protein [Neolewinella antarctica]|uniref:Maltokinase n=1 Tax=Neolewinella antarctica TaxID=442734 RepID=A0ABX0X6V3_9BACT|nr:phosphotransferase [Neolewinella antarctica]NJC24862.1 maltose alpha-D-glucosyltransferase/alpha-amylase [Neolewinella antarctica]